MRTFADISLYIYSALLSSTVPAEYCSKELLYRCNQRFQTEAVFIKNSPSKPTFLFMEMYWF